MPGAPFPLCVHHLAEAWQFAGQRIRDARAGRLPIEQRQLPSAEALTAMRRAGAPKRPGIVYYLRIGPLIKIGVTWDLEQRLRAYPPNVEVLATEVGDSTTERTRLAQFRDHVAYPARHEWFHPAPELLAYIEALPPGLR